MLHSLRALDGFRLMALEGQIGKIKDIYFDDHRWVIRYLEIDTGGWLRGRRVLISPLSIESVDWDRDQVIVRLTRRQVEDSPSIDSAKPVSRQQEAALADYYSHPYYWSGHYIYGETTLPTMADSAAVKSAGNPSYSKDSRHDDTGGNAHLRSKDEVVGYRIGATDNDVGHVDDFLFDEHDWTISHMVIDTRNWWAGKHVLISPRCISDISWAGKCVSVDLTRAQIEQSLEYDQRQLPSAPSEQYNDVYRQAAGMTETSPFIPDPGLSPRRDQDG